MSSDASTDTVNESVTSELFAGFVMETVGGIVSITGVGSSCATFTVIWSDDSLLLESIALASIWFEPVLSVVLSTVKS